MKGRKIKERINTGLAILIFLCIVILINLISIKRYKRFDFTTNKIYTLSPQTKKILKNLKENLNIYAFYKETFGEKKKAQDLFEQYKEVSNKIKYQFIDPDRELGKAKKYQVTSYGTIVLEYGENIEKVFNPEEKDITTAILKLTKKGKKKIYFTKGHGERNLDNFDGEGISNLKTAIENEQYETKEVLIMREGIPTDCDIISICGPKTDFIEGEIKELKKYLDSGGRIFMFMEPGTYPNLSKFASEYGIKIGNNVIVDLTGRIFLGNAVSPVIMDYPYHEITKDFKLASIFSFSCSVEPLSNVSSNIKVETIAKTSSNSWAETNLNSVYSGVVNFDPEKDKKGPISVSVVGEIEIETGKEGEKKKGRIAVFGDSDFVSNKLLNSSGNKDFVLNTFGWLAEEEVLISIRSKEKENQPLILTSKQGKIIFYIPIVIIPLLIFSSGLFICIRRKLKY